MHPSRNLLLGLCILLVASPRFAQNPLQTARSAPVAPAVTIPSYPDTQRGLENLLDDMMKFTKDGDNQALAAYLKSLALPNPDDWFKAVFGDDDGPLHAAASASLRSAAGTTFPSTLATMLKDNRTIIEAHKFENSCDKYATEKEYPLLLQRHSPVPLYDARFKDATSESIWSYFAYVDGGFRYVGNLSVNPPALLKNPIAQQGSQPSTDESQITIRGGGNVQTPKLIHQEVPKYRKDAKAAHIEGTVIIQVVISKEGSIREAELVQGVCVLAEPALAAIKKWRYTPTLVQGNPVELDTTITVVFKLG